MNAIDRRIRELEEYAPPRTAQPDFADFWNRIQSRYRDRPAQDARSPADALSSWNTRVYDIAYRGFDDTPIRGWFLVPAGQQRPVPCVVVFPGYTGGRGYPFQHAALAALGFAVLAVDVRGQGGATGNRLTSESGMSRGWVTQGIEDLMRSYYLAMLVDAWQAIEWAARQPEVDPARIASFGASQGGGLALAAAALSGRTAAAVGHIPNLCHLDYAILHSTGSASEIAAYCERHPDRLADVLKNLSYFDLMNLGERISVPSYWSVGLKDAVCPPETVFAAYSRAGGDKRIAVMPFTGHAVTDYHFYESMLFLKERLGEGAEA
jgi:cephalosporin-C deacetylase